MSLHKHNAAPLQNTTIIFLFLAPVVTISYALFIFNPSNMGHPILYILQIIADCIGMAAVIGLWLTILMDIIVPSHHRPHQSQEISQFLASKPEVDVLIPTAGEPIDIIEKTVEAAMRISYQHQTIILDDGGSNEVKKLAKKFNCGYLRRKSSVHAKAGNLNHGLENTSGEFFVILDADQIAQENFIDVLLPYMADQQVAMVQSPQSYTNTEKFIASGTAQAQDIFYRFVCAAKNTSNSAFCVGTNVMFRRSAIDQIGGIAQINHSEDIWTSYYLHQRGYKTVFIRDVLARGLAPSDVHSYFKQQVRWARGGFSMLFQNNPLKASALTIDQRLQYLLTNSFFFVGITIVIYLAMPIMYLLFNLQPFENAQVHTWLLHYLPYVAMYYSLTWLLLGKIEISTMAVSVASFWPYLKALFKSILNSNDAWVATTKSSNQRQETPIMYWIWPHVLVIMLSFFSIIVGWFDSDNFWASFFFTALATWNSYLLLRFIRADLNSHTSGLESKDLIASNYNQVSFSGVKS